MDVRVNHYAGGLRGIPAPPSPRPPDEARAGVGSGEALGCAPGLHLGGHWEAWRRVGVVHDADRPTRADNGRVASYSMHTDIDLRIDGNWITRILQSA